MMYTILKSTNTDMSAVITDNGLIYRPGGILDMLDDDLQTLVIGYTLYCLFEDQQKACELLKASGRWPKEAHYPWGEVA